MPVIHGTPELVCPKCGNSDEFQAMALIPVQVSCNGGSITRIFSEQGVGLTPDAPCVCMECEYSSTVAEFAGLPEAVASDGSFVVAGQEGNA